MLSENLRHRVDSLYQEVWDLARHIVQARKQIADLRPSKLKSQNIPRAVREMDEIVRSTEEASNAIMEAAETIAAGDPLDPGYAAMIQQNCSRIFEACAFQDLTGQRISKVMVTLQLVDQHLAKLQELLGPEFDESDDDVEEEIDGEKATGPSLSGEAISQDDIDKLFD